MLLINKNIIVLTRVIPIYLDGLVSNIYWFMDNVNTILRNASRDERFALCMLDIDDFKLVNDNFGHIAGDKVLTRFADKLKTLVGEDNLAGRIGGDEFMAFIRFKDDADTEWLIKSLLIKQRDKYNVISISTSIGVALSSPGCLFEQLYDIADKALYVAKEKGKNRYCINYNR